MPKKTQDFTMTPSPASLTINAGYSSTVAISFTSLNEFGGNISITSTVTPSNNPPTVSGLQTITLASDGGAIDDAVVSTSSSMSGNYTVTFQGKTASLSHTVSVMIMINPAPPPPPPDFALSASPSSIVTTNYRTVASTISIYSISGYSGNVALSATLSPASNGINVALSPSTVILRPGGSNMSTLTVTIGNATGTFAIIITGVSGSHIHSLQIPLIVTQSSGFESLNLEFSAFQSSTNLTLYIRNVGPTTVRLVSYYARDSSGNQYSLTAWNGPVISPNNLGIATILIGSSCSGCTLTGTAFTFNVGSSYSIAIVTSRNNIFTFTVTR